MTSPPRGIEREQGWVAQPSSWWQAWEDEPTPELQWPLSIKVYDRMERQDSQVQSVLRAVMYPVQQTDWRIEPAAARDEVVQDVADNLGLPIKGVDQPAPSPRDRGRFSWSQHLEWALLEVVYGHMCVDSQTEALTQRGWLRGDQLREGDLLYTLNPATGLAEWQPLETVHRYSGTHVVRQFEGRSHSSVTTLDHRWIVRDHNSRKLRFRTTATLSTGDAFVRAAPSGDLPIEAKYQDALVELVAWYWTEGKRHDGGGVSIWQSETANADKAQRIRAALTALYGPARVSLRHGHGPALHGWRESTRTGGVSRGQVTEFYLDQSAAAVLHHAAPDKVVTLDFLRSLTSAQLVLFIETSIDGDGHRRPSGQRLITQSDDARLSAFEAALSLAGLAWSRSELRNGGGWQTRIGDRNEIRPVAAARRGGQMTDHLTVVHDGVWCPQVPNRTWLARRRGTVWFTGNCFEQVADIVTVGGRQRARLRKLAPRWPQTIRKFNVARDGGLESIEQWPLPGERDGRPLDINRLVVYSWERRGGSWTGRSLLRAAYKPWLLKDQDLLAWTIGIDRNSVGVPLFKDAPDNEYRDEGTKLAKGLRAGSEAGGYLPNGTELELAGVKGTLIDPEKAVRYMDEQIARSVLAHFLNLGTQTGSWALGSTFAEFFVGSLNKLAKHIADVATQHIVEDLVDWNFGESEPAPKVSFTPIGQDSMATVQAVKALIEAGAIFPDPKLDAFVRDIAGLPPRAPFERFPESSSSSGE